MVLVCLNIKNEYLNTIILIKTHEKTEFQTDLSFERALAHRLNPYSLLWPPPL